jgi:hypothetical protein
VPEVRIPSPRYPLLRSLTLTQTDVAQEVIDILVATKKHDILIFTRRVRPSYPDLHSSTNPQP